MGEMWCVRERGTSSDESPLVKEQSTRDDNRLTTQLRKSENLIRRTENGGLGLSFKGMLDFLASCPIFRLCKGKDRHDLFDCSVIE